jgi:MFS superfamily sulfate permease-like transporter
MAGRNRLSTFSSGVNQIPIAILACVMIMIAINTSN